VPHRPKQKEVARKGLTVEEYRARLKDGQAKEKHFIGVRNAWRAIVKKRALQLKHALERRKAQQKPHVVGKGAAMRVVGGTAPERLVFAMQYAHKVFRLEYSEAGTWVKGYGLTNVPAGRGYRTDCSWWYTMLRFACGIKGPSIDGGYTGAILTEGKVVDEAYARTHPGTAVIFGSGDGFHAAASLGDGSDACYQHGVPEVDIGTFGQFGADTEVRFRAFDNHPRKG
jgi:hypothetical protein